MLARWPHRSYFAKHIFSIKIRNEHLCKDTEGENTAYAKKNVCVLVTNVNISKSLIRWQALDQFKMC